MLLYLSWPTYLHTSRAVFGATGLEDLSRLPSILLRSRIFATHNILGSYINNHCNTNTIVVEKLVTGSSFT